MGTKGASQNHTKSQNRGESRSKHGGEKDKESKANSKAQIDKSDQEEKEGNKTKTELRQKKKWKRLARMDPMQQDMNVEDMESSGKKHSKEEVAMEEDHKRSKPNY